MNLNIQKVLLDLINSPNIKYNTKLIVFDCLLNILKDHENINTVLSENALIIFIDMLSDEKIPDVQIIKCLKSIISYFTLILSYLSS